jgi:hypothetical protein
MTQQTLDNSYIHSAIQSIRSERVPQQVWMYPSGQGRTFTNLL